MSSYQFSKKEIKREVLKCGKDPVYFINTYAKIVHPKQGLVPFNTYPFQTQLLKDFMVHRFNVILKARQLGISTITAAYVVWLMMFYKQKNILVIATQFKTATNLVKKVKSIIHNLPDFLKIAKITIDNRASFELSNGSQIKATSTSADAGRSEALSLLVVDEAAHIENMDELWAGLYPTVSTGGEVIALSTPKGVGNWFHKICVSAEEGSSDFYITKLPWQVHPEHGEEWFENETKNMSKREIAQEYLCNFNASGETVIHPDDIIFYKESIKEPKYKVGFDRNYWIWEEYDPRHSYLISADVSRGDGKDFSAFHVLNLETMEIVAEYYGKPDLETYSDILISSATEYGSALLVVENNNVGLVVLEKLIDKGYDNLYFSTKVTHEYVEHNSAMMNPNVISGFTTSMKTRPIIIAKLEEFLRNRALKIPSLRTVNELTTFVWLSGKPQAMKGYNDDLVMSLSIACWVRDTAIVKSNRDRQYSESLLNSMIYSSTQLDTKIKGMDGYDKKKDFVETMVETKSQKENFLWLYKG
jgi:hypothetical protein